MYFIYYKLFKYRKQHRVKKKVNIPMIGLYKYISFNNDIYISNINIVDVYNVIANCEKYGEFLPYCCGLFIDIYIFIFITLNNIYLGCKIIKKHSSTVFEAEMTVGFKIFTEKYISHITLNVILKKYIHFISISIYMYIIGTYICYCKSIAITQF